MTLSITATPASITQRRWQLATVLSVTVFIGFLDRINVSLALPLIAEAMQWQAAEKQHYGSLLMSLFYVAYGLANILLSPLGSKFGPRKSLLLIISLWSIFTSLGAWFSQSITLFLASRLLLGLSEGIHIPMLNELTQRWFPSHERSRANSIWIAGLFLAVLHAPLILVPIMDRYGWQAGFHGLALLGILVSLPLVYLHVFNKPQEHPNISEEEQQYLERNNALANASPATSTVKMIRNLIRQPSFLLMAGSGILNSMLTLGISSWLPSYFASKSGVRYDDLAWIATFPYIFSLLGLFIWSRLGDKYNCRAQSASIGFLLAGGFVFVAFSVTSLWLALAMFCGGVFCITAFNSCEFALIQHLIPSTHIAEGAGFYNGLSTMIGGGLGTWLVGYFMADGSTKVDSLPLMGIFMLAALLTYLLKKHVHY